MRVIHVNAGNLFGGVESFLLTIARYRDSASTVRHEFALCFEGRLSSELRKRGATVHMLGDVQARRPWTIRRARSTLRKVAGTGEPTTIVGHGPWPYALAAPAVDAAHRVLFVHGLLRGTHWVERWARFTPPDLILTNSQFTQLNLGASFSSVPTRVLTLPVAPPPPFGAQTRKETREELKTADDAVVIVIAARWEELKGHRMLVEALARIAERPRWVCWIAGGAQREHERRYLEEVQASVKSAGIQDRLRFLGEHNDVPRLLAAADIHCQPNTTPEPFGVAFVEALYAGLPVVTTSQGGVLEILDDTCSLLVPPGDVGALANALGRTIDQPELRATLGSAGVARAKRLCDPEQQLTRLEQILQTPATQRPAAPAWSRWLGELTRRLPRGRYRVPDLACQVAERLGGTPPFVSAMAVQDGNLSFVCDLRDKNAREVCFTRRYEPQETALIETLIASGQVFVDVGANWGYFTLLAAASVGPRGRVLAFEPDPRMYALLSENVTHNDLGQVELFQIAAADQAGSLLLDGFSEENGNWGISTLATDQPKTGARTFEVRARTIDQVIEEEGITTVDLLKMDIEGAEGLALEGMRDGLREHRYRRILLELHPAELAKRGLNIADTTARLREAGYQGWRVDHSFAATRRAAYATHPDPSEFMRPFRTSDLLGDWPHVLWLAPGLEPPWTPR